MYVNLKEMKYEFLEFKNMKSLKYKKLRKSDWRSEQARQVSPLELKTQAVYTDFSDD